MSVLQEKALVLLRVLSMEMGSTKRQEALGSAVRRYSDRAVDVKLLELSRRGYIDYGTNPCWGWLTDKGRDALQGVDKKS